MNFLQPNNRIYHYCSLRVALELILPNFKLRFSRIENTNDPRETKSYWFKHSNFIYLDKEFDINNLEVIDILFSSILRNDCKLICFSTDKEHYWGSLLSKMWAHYGDNHSGICLEIDKQKFINENSEKYDFTLFKDVKYQRFDPHEPLEHTDIDHKLIAEMGRDVYLKNIFRKENIDYLFFTKNEEWASETEVRLLHFSDSLENEYCSIKDSLANIHLGVNFHKSYIPAVKELVRNSEIKIVGQKYGDRGLIFDYIQQ